MTVLEIDRLRARYSSGDAELIARFDEALTTVADGGLDEALLDHVELRADHVCIRDLLVPVELDRWQSAAAMAHDWAQAIVAALGARLDRPDGIAVYPSLVDALTDVVRSVAATDRTRVWAWRQIGLIDAHTTWPTRRHVAALLASHAECVPATLARCADLHDLPVDAVGWLEIARAVSSAVGADTAEPDEPVGAIADAPAGLSAPCRVVAARLPWHAADEVDRRVLATLVLAVGEPWAVRDHARVAGVAAAFERLPIPSRRDGASPSTAGIEHEEPSGHIGPRGRVHDTDVSSPTDAPARADLPVDAEQSTTRAEDLDRSSVAEDQGEDLGVHEVPQLPVSGFGGLFFLIHVFEALDIVASIGDDGQSFRSAPIPEVIAHLAARIGGAPLDDPAVLALSGVPDDDVDRLQIDLAPAVDTALDEIVAAMRTWLAMRLDDDPSNLEWVWARPARLHVEPGWIEVRLDLADVDVRLRVAGLDLDPGFVWWRGAIVRFRYV